MWRPQTLPQFDRQVQVNLTLDTETVSISGLRVSFRVEKTKVTGTLDRGQVTIYNLSPMTREKINDTDQYVSLLAGYADINLPMSHLFEGNLSTYSHEFDGVDIETKLTFYDGQEVQAAAAMVGHKKGVNAYTVLKSLVKKANTTLDTSLADLSLIQQKQYSTGFNHAGTLKEGLDIVCEDLYLDWTIEEGGVKVIQQGTPNANQDLILIDPHCGMIGTPTRIDDVTVKTGKQKKKKILINLSKHWVKQ